MSAVLVGTLPLGIHAQSGIATKKGQQQSVAELAVDDSLVGDLTAVGSKVSDGWLRDTVRQERLPELHISRAA